MKCDMPQIVNTLIQIAMEEHQVSRAEMARRLGITPVTVTVALNNRARDWKITTLGEWADAMNCDLHVEFRSRQKVTPSGVAESGTDGSGGRHKAALARLHSARVAQSRRRAALPGAGGRRLPLWGGAPSRRGNKAEA